MIRVIINTIAKTFFLLTILAAGVFLFTVSASAATINVTTTADEAGSVGSGCALREAVTAINSSSATGGCPAGDGSSDTIVLPAGTYTLSLDGQGENGNATGDIDISAPMTIQGAGKGLTIISGNTAATDTVRDRIFDINTSTTVNFEGLTMTEGLVSQPGADIYGGAIYAVANVTLNFTNVALTNNRLKIQTSYEDMWGCAIWFEIGGGFSFTNSDITNNGCDNNSMNTRSFGGAIGVNWQGPNSGDVSLVNSTVTGNYAYGYIVEGGTFYLNHPNSVTVTNTTISNNQAIGTDPEFNQYSSAWTAAMLIYGSSTNIPTVTVTNSTFDSNVVDITSPTSDALGYGSAFTVFNGNTTVTNSIFNNNSITSHSNYYNEMWGAGIYAADAGSLTINSSQITNNVIDSNANLEDCEYLVGAGIYASTATKAVINNSTISGNSITYTYTTYNGYDCSIVFGAGVLVESDADMSFNTIANNHVDEADWNEGKDQYGSGIFNWGGTLNLKANIFDNAQNGNMNCYEDTGTGVENLSIGYNVDTDGTCITNPSPGTGDTTSAPNLGPLQNNGGNTLTHALLSGSPALDLSPVCTDVDGLTLSTDQRGSPRPFNTNCDSGAYEFQSVVAACIVEDQFDYTLLVEQPTPTPTPTIVPVNVAGDIICGDDSSTITHYNYQIGLYDDTDPSPVATTITSGGNFSFNWQPDPNATIHAIRVIDDPSPYTGPSAIDCNVPANNPCGCGFENASYEGCSIVAGDPNNSNFEFSFTGCIAVATPTPTPTVTITPTLDPSITPTITPTIDPSITPSVTPTPSNTPIPSATPMASNTPVPSSTPNPSVSPTPPGTNACGEACSPTNGCTAGNTCVNVGGGSYECQANTCVENSNACFPDMCTQWYVTIVKTAAMECVNASADADSLFVQFIITASNPDATNTFVVDIVDIIDPGLLPFIDLNSFDPEPDTITNNILTWENVSLPPGSEVEFIFTGTVPRSAFGSYPYNVTATNAVDGDIGRFIIADDIDCTPENPDNDVLGATSLPSTALSSDQYFRLVMGLYLISLGALIYKLSFHEHIGDFFWNSAGKWVFGKFRIEKKDFEKGMNKQLEKDSPDT
ncbi:hypothetical protein KC909_04150 [Candidatus Dojkabacteria bacterium]|uniref:CSLREA domain-containing protein n=1 Tax=Candidatus Dojkabacteria bacterium TaxID=2099670 RepID=A0A955RJ90_9BACT|nr:hypothetical protein [Candidatus Dojkabacteria bacterium]